MKVCPYHSSLTDGFRLYSPRHECFTVYDQPAPAARACPDDPADVPGEVSE